MLSSFQPVSISNQLKNNISILALCTLISRTRKQNLQMCKTKCRTLNFWQCETKTVDCTLKTAHHRSDVQCRLRINLNAGHRLLRIYIYNATISIDGSNSCNSKQVLFSLAYATLSPTGALFRLTGVQIFTLNSSMIKQQYPILNLKTP